MKLGMTEILNIKKDLADYQTNFLCLIKNTSEKLSDLYHIDDIVSNHYFRIKKQT